MPNLSSEATETMHPHEENITAGELRLRTQKDLVEAHVTLIRMQQQLLGGDPIVTYEARSAATVPHDVDPMHGITTSAPLRELLEGESEGHLPRPRSPELTDTKSWTIQGWFKSHVLLLGIGAAFALIVALVGFSPKPPSDEIRRLETELDSTKTRLRATMEEQSRALAATQQDLERTQRALKETQTTLHNTEQALEDTRSLSSAGGIANVSSTPSQAAAQATATIPQVVDRADLAKKMNLQNLRNAVIENRRALFRNQREYLVVSRSLAAVRREIALAQLEKSKFSPESGVSTAISPILQSTVSDFLPPLARNLERDPRVTSGQTESELFPEDTTTAESEITSTELPPLTAATSKELDSVRRQLTSVIGELTHTQKSLSDAQTKLKAVQEEIRELEEKDVIGEKLTE